MLMQQQVTQAFHAGSKLLPRDTAMVTDVLGHAARKRVHTRSDTTDYATTYLWLDAGQSWPFLRKFDTISQRAMCGWLFAVAAGCAWAMIMMMAVSGRPEDATLHMERLADGLDGTTAIPAATANAVARLVGQSWYDCRRAACSANW